MAENVLDKNSESPKSALLVLLKMLFSILVIAGVCVFLFFTSQLTTKLDGVTANFDITNVSNDLAKNNDLILENQTEINLYRFLKIKGYFDEFSYNGDFYLQYYKILNSQTSSEAEKAIAKQEMILLEENLRTSFKEIREEYANPIISNLIAKEYDETVSTESIFEEALINKLNDSAMAIKNNNDPQAIRDYTNYIDTRSLVANNTLKSLVISTDFDSLNNEEIYQLVQNINSLIVNDLSTMQEVKEQRIKWSDIIDEIELRTKEIDNYYTQDYYDDLGGVRYTNYDFDKEAKTISIVGETKRIDTKNFTVIANLIDELNESDFFENGEMKSFSKSGSVEEGYTANLKLTLDLQEGFSTADGSLEISKEPELLNN